MRKSSAASAVARALLMAAVLWHGWVLATVLGQPVAERPVESRPALLRRLYHDVNFAPGPGADFLALYHAGMNARRGLSPYEEVEAVRVTPYHFPYRYLPLTAQTLGRGLSRLSPGQAWTCWVLTIESCLLAAIVALRRTMPSGRWRLFAAVVLLASVPHGLELYMGQFTFVAAAATVLATVVWSSAARFRAREGLAAVLIGAGALLKIYPLVALPAFMRDRRGMLWGSLVVAAIAVTSLPLLWNDALAADRFWFKNLVGEPLGFDAGNHSLLFLVYRVSELAGLPWDLAAWGRLCLVWRIGVLTFTAAVVAGRRTPATIGVATLLLAHFVSYFQIWEHHLSAAVLAGVLLLGGVAGRTSRTFEYVTAAAVVALALPSPFLVLGSDPAAWQPVARVLPPLCKAVPLVALYGIGLACTAGWSRIERVSADATREQPEAS